MKNVLGHTLDLLGQAIVAGEHPQGSSLPPEPTLCAELGVSRTVVREAVKSLAAKGLVVTGPKVGTRVQGSDQWNWFDPAVVRWNSAAGMSRDYLRNLQELRRLVEPAAARWAAERATAEDIAEIESAYAGMRQAVEQGGDYVTHDLRFHQGLLRACHNRLLVQMGQALGALLRTRFELGIGRHEEPGASLPLHRAVLDAVAAHNPAKAERAIRKLIDSSHEDLDEALKTRRRMPALSSAPTRLVRRTGTTAR